MDPIIHPVHAASRIVQFDADDLDHSIEETFLDQFKKILENFPSIPDNLYDPEFIALFRCLIWYFSLRKCGCTLGQRMLNISYENFLVTKTLKWSYFCLRIILPYFRVRFDTLMSIFFSEYPLTDLIQRKLMPVLDMTFDFLHLLNSFRFLNCGDYRNLIERILELHVVHIERPALGESDFSGMGRELLWHAFADLLTFLTPLLKLRRYWLKLKRKLRSKSMSSQAKTSDSSSDNNTKSGSKISSPNEAKSSNNTSTTGDDEKTEPFLIDDDARIEKIAMDFDTKCACCSKYPILPSHIGCSHVFCYYCISAHLKEDSSFPCPVCDSMPRCDIRPVVIK